MPPHPEWQGHSLFDPARPDRAFLMAIAGGDVFGVRDGRWKYIYDVTSAEESLFDLSADPAEQSGPCGARAGSQPGTATTRRSMGSV